LRTPRLSRRSRFQESLMPRHSRGFDTEAAFAHLCRRDRRLGAWMQRLGPIPADPRWRKPFDPVDALARAILYQQLSGKAAATIVGRVEAAIGSDRLHCDTLARRDDADLRGCGVSGNKLLALRDLARREESGELPSLRRMATMDDAAIVDALVPIRGIGRWTVQMMLMFRLGRPDVLPVDDLGIRKGAQVIDKLPDMPMPKDLAARGERWGPYRSYASIYLWRIADAASAAAEPVKRSQE
jgi:DNA-3-methyladenine glycosylase II